MKLTTFDLCVKITSAFEGTEYDTIAGNFDGQGISAGILQWNLGSGTLQAYILNHINMMAHSYFPADVSVLQNLKKDESVVWAKDMMLDVNGKLKPDWLAAWKRFMSDPTVINQQKRAIDLYYHQAKQVCGRLGFPQDNRRAMAFSFDIAVQSWNLGIDVPEPNLEQAKTILQMYGIQNIEVWANEALSVEQQRLVIAAHYHALKQNPRWRSVVFARKATIAVGIGWVNKTKWDFRKLFKES